MTPALLTVVALLTFATLSGQRTAEWRTERSLWTAATERGPLMPRSWLCLGLAHKDDERWEDAATAFVRCRDLSMQRHDAGLASRASNNLGSVAYETGRLDLAEGYYLDAVSMVPDYDDALANLATVSFRRAQEARDVSMLPEVAARYRRVLELRPTHGQAWSNLAVVLGALGDADGAAEAAAEARRLGWVR